MTTAIAATVPGDTLACQRVNVPVSWLTIK